MAPVNRLLTLCLLLPPVIPSLAAAQTTPPAGGAATRPATQPADNIGHRHHHHRHGQDHPRVLDAGRFFTDRPAAQLLPLPAEEETFFFVVFGDRTAGPATGVAVLADAVRDTNLLEPDFVITVGDLVEGYNEEPQWLEQMREFKAIMDRLKCPWFPVAGNHDVYWRDTDKSGDARPAGEHERLYEMHFGPLWYAYEHKDSFFIVLYSDEGDPATGEKSFEKPEAQRMSPEQLAWLRQTLARAKDAQHVFVFLHHPRWTKGGYGDDWQNVHAALVEAGNVRAVFAGHIHTMRYDGPVDGIEYVALATTGGDNSLEVPRAGMLHHFNIVTVRQNQISMAAVPVGEMIDPRQITPELQSDAQRLARARARISPVVELGSDGSADAEMTASIRNPTRFAAEVTIAPASEDSRWQFVPDHAHVRLEPGQEHEFRFAVRRHGAAQPVAGDETLRPASLALSYELLTEGFRYVIPGSRTPLPIDAGALRPPRPEVEMALALSGSGSFARVEPEAADVGDEPFTLEAWVRPARIEGQQGIACKTESSGYGLFVNDGQPSFPVRFKEGYVEPRAPEPVLRAGRWHHIAGVYDGREVRLYVDGRLVASAPAEGARVNNDLPLLIGADVTGAGRGASFFQGEIDAVRLSAAVRYEGGQFTPARRLEPDAACRLLFDFDGRAGPWVFDSSPQAVQAVLEGEAGVVPAGR